MHIQTQTIHNTKHRVGSPCTRNFVVKKLLLGTTSDDFSSTVGTSNPITGLKSAQFGDFELCDWTMVPFLCVTDAVPGTRPLGEISACYKRFAGSGAFKRCFFFHFGRCCYVFGAVMAGFSGKLMYRTTLVMLSCCLCLPGVSWLPALRSPLPVSRCYGSIWRLLVSSQSGGSHQLALL